MVQESRGGSALLERLTTMERRLADQEQELHSLRAQVAPGGAGNGTAQSTVLPQADGAKSSRRSLLRAAGVSAAAMLAAGALGTAQESVQATDNLPLLLGAANDANNTAATTTKLSPVGGTTPAVLLSVDNIGPGTGIVGSSASGSGVVANSASGIALQITGSGRFMQTPASFVGTPTTGVYTKGEYILDSNGQLYICSTSGSGSNPGTFRRIFGRIFNGSASAGVTYFLTTPIRLLDTRPGSGSPLSAPSPVPPGVQTFQIGGTAVGGVSVPVGAVGLIGNITAVNPTAAGDVRLFPGGGTVPLVSNLNYVAGVTVANSFIVPVPLATSALGVQVDVGATDLIIDISGFIQ